MTRTLQLVCALVCTCSVLLAQTLIDLKTQGKRIDFADAAATRPAKTGASLPAVCKIGEMFFLTSAAAGSNIWGCVATNVWFKQASGGGSGTSGPITTDDLEDCRPSRSSAEALLINACKFGFPNRSTANIPAAGISLTSGSGTAFIYATSAGVLEVKRSGTLVLACNGCTDAGPDTGFPADVARIASWNATAGAWDAAAATDERATVHGPIQIQPDAGIRMTVLASGEKRIGIDSAVIATRSGIQSGQDTFCAGSGSATAQTCVLTPALTAYTRGMRIHFQPGSTSTGTVSLNINGLGAAPVREADGSTEMSPGELSAQRIYELTYDGSAFRLASGNRVRMTKYIPVMSASSGSARLNTAVNIRGAGGISGNVLHSPASASVYSWASATLPDSGAAELGIHADLPVNWLSTPGITVRVHYYVPSGSPAPVTLKGQISCTASGESIQSAFVSQNSAATASGTPSAAGMQSVLALPFAGAALNGCAPGKLAHLRVWRDSADSFTDAVEALALEVEYWAGLE